MISQPGIVIDTKYRYPSQRTKNEHCIAYDEHAVSDEGVVIAD